jgi:putative sporulation protein YyaC
MNILKTKIQQKTEYFNPEKEYAFVKLGNSLIEQMSQNDWSPQNTIVLCIGTDRATGDALGPLVGDMLTHSSNEINVAGTLHYPVHALNMRDTIDNIYDSFYEPFIIAVDASLGMARDVGLITLTNAPMYPGKGVNKKLPAIGNISITGIVNVSGHTGVNLLQSTRLYLVKNMAECISQAIIYAYNYLSSPL